MHNEYLARAAEQAVRHLRHWGFVFVEETCPCGSGDAALCRCEGQGRVWAPRETGRSPKSPDRLIVDIFEKERAKRSAEWGRTNPA